MEYRLHAGADEPAGESEGIDVIVSELADTAPLADAVEIVSPSCAAVEYSPVSRCAKCGAPVYGPIRVPAETPGPLLVQFTCPCRFGD